ncbi:MAG: hypothetical protein K8F57_04290, partial [Alphaproteobacteria bacterium]|nr:hypothetical protein [Alphaproteobacteria bacterium]
MFAEDREVWPLWLPVFLGAGIAVYFGLSVEPPGWVGAVLFAAALAACIPLRRRFPAWLFPGIAAVALAAANP